MPRIPRHIGESIKLLIRDLGFEKKVNEIRVIEEWDKIVGPNIAKIARVERVEGSILYVKVSSMTWRTELLFQKQAILQKIETVIGKDIIKDIRFY
ncbi:MAG: DUF721 domain-containing protein [Calditrichaeota bacterium]|nr:MAG: DUF721 domain-containing protein [Calditrichota bacterium]